MILRAIADTHAAVWYLFGDERLSERARQMIEEAATEGARIGVSAVTLAEIVFLVEKGRLPQATLEQLTGAFQNEDGVLVGVSFDHQIALRMRDIPRDVVPDLPDRMIAATALHLGAAVISRDRQIRLSQVETIW